jgi:nitrite reductase (NADH) small subunit
MIQPSSMGGRLPSYSVGRADQFAEGERRVVVCGDKEIGIFKLEGEFYAWHNRCGHLGGPVCQGRVLRRVLEPLGEDRTSLLLQFDDSETHIICPWHGYEFSIKTGLHPGNSRWRLRKADLEVRDGDIYVSV